jgi:hypothetical protein
VLGIYADEDTDGNEPQKPAQKAQQRTVNATRSDSDDKKVSAPPQIPQNDSEAVKWAKIRMRFLTHIKAAPGQPMNALLEDYMLSKKWISAGQTVGDWPPAHIPTTEPQVKAFMEDWQEFEMRKREQDLEKDLL